MEYEECVISLQKLCTKFLPSEGGLDLSSLVDMI